MYVYTPGLTTEHFVQKSICEKKKDLYFQNFLQRINFFFFQVKGGSKDLKISDMDDWDEDNDAFDSDSDKEKVA